MASKPFYSMEEVCEKLGKSEEDVKGLVRDGQLREFRDAGKVFFKADDIDKLAGAAAGGEDEDVQLEAVTELDDLADDGLPSLTEDTSGGTSIIGLEPLDDEAEDEPVSTPPPPPADSSDAQEDTAVPKTGVGVFDDDELDIDADPMAKTQITTGGDDQVSLEGTGSGSGLLDLAREADDTALGADLLDEIYPGDEEPEAEAPEAEEAEEEPEEAEEDEAELAEPVTETVIAAPIVVAGDPFEGIFGGLLVTALILMAIGNTIVAAALQGFFPDFAEIVSSGTNFYFFLGGAVLLALLTAVIGWFLGRPRAPKVHR
jgi:hypothetical protein